MTGAHTHFYVIVVALHILEEANSSNLKIWTTLFPVLFNTTFDAIL